MPDFLGDRSGEAGRAGAGSSRAEDAQDGARGLLPLRRISAFTISRSAPPQRLLVTVEVWVDEASFAGADEVRHAWDYDFLRTEIGTLAAGRRFNLQETLVREIYDLVAARARRHRATGRDPQAGHLSGLRRASGSSSPLSSPAGAFARKGRGCRAPAGNRRESPPRRRRSYPQGCSVRARRRAGSRRGGTRATYRAPAAPQPRRRSRSAPPTSAASSPGRRRILSETGRPSAVCRKICVSLSPGSEPGTWKAWPTPVMVGGGEGAIASRRMARSLASSAGL